MAAGIEGILATTSPNTPVKTVNVGGGVESVENFANFNEPQQLATFGTISGYLVANSEEILSIQFG